MIYSRFGEPVKVLRLATLEDVATLERRKPDKIDKEQVGNRAVLVIRYGDGHEMTTHIAYLRADKGLREINDALIEIHPELAELWR